MANYITMLEGKQAEEYLRNKLRKKEEQNDKIDDRNERKHGTDREDGVVYKKEPTHSTSKKNPSYNNAREIRDHRIYYGSVMPSTTKSENRLKKAEQKETDAHKYASKIADSYRNKKIKDRKYKDYKDVDKNVKIAYDAADRHYRRHEAKKKPVKESADISINVKII